MRPSLILATLSLALTAQTPVPATAPQEAKATAPQEVTKASATPAPKAPVADKVLATIGGTAIHQSDFEVFKAVTLPEAQARQMASMPGAEEQYLKRFLDYKVLAAKATAEGLTRGPEFAKKMELMKMQILIQDLFSRDGDKLKARTAVKDEEVKAYFDKHADKFTNPESFSARHILVSTQAQDDGKARTDEEAVARVKEAQAALKAGKTFEEVAKTFSDDPGSKDKGGLYENTAFGRFVPEFDKAVREQPLGKVGEPVKTMFGYHLIQVEKITPAAPQPFEEAKDAARQQLTAERQEQVMNAYMDEAKTQVRYHEGTAPEAAKPVSASKHTAKRGNKK